jgi:hypothetical protein
MEFLSLPETDESRPGDIMDGCYGWMAVLMDDCRDWLSFSICNDNWLIIITVMTMT